MTPTQRLDSRVLAVYTQMLSRATDEQVNSETFVRAAWLKAEEEVKRHEQQL
jgi:hypothetical protein